MGLVNTPRAATTKPSERTIAAQTPTAPSGGASAIERFRANLIESLGDDIVTRHLGTDVRWVGEGSALTLKVGSVFHKGVLERRFAGALRDSLEGTGLSQLTI